MPWCPVCGAEYDPGVRECVDCGVDLTPEKPPDDVGKEPVIIMRATTAHEAQIVVATLRAEDIPAYTGSPDPYLPQYGNPVVTISPEFLVWVPADAVEDALTVLSESVLQDTEDASEDWGE